MYSFGEARRGIDSATRHTAAKSHWTIQESMDLAGWFGKEEGWQIILA